MQTDQAQGTPDHITLKVIVPSASVCKTVRLPIKVKVKELHTILAYKLASLSNVPQHVYEDFGFCWQSDAGPVWLAEASSLRAYNFKSSSISVEFKKRSGLSSSSGTIQTIKTNFKKDEENNNNEANIKKNMHETPLSPILSQSPSPPAPKELSLKKKMSAWVNSRQSSPYEPKKDKDKDKDRDKDKDKKKERPHSVNVQPGKRDPEAAVNATRFTSPSYSPTFENSPSPLSPSQDSPPVSPSYGTASLDDLDDLIHTFDDLAVDYSGPDLSDETLLDEYAANIDDEDLLAQADTTIDETELSPRFTYRSSTSSDPSTPNGTRQRSYSSPYDAALYQNARDAAHSAPVVGYSSSPETNLDLSDDFGNMPGLRGASAKHHDNRENTNVRVAAAISLLEDVLEGIDVGSSTMPSIRQYVYNALCVLRTI